MGERQIIEGGFYKHFKDKLYQVRGIAYHSETKEKMVVYQALYGDYALYVRPYDMFIGEVDHCKYPDVAQKYRFEQVFMENQEVKASGDNAPVIGTEMEMTVSEEQWKTEETKTPDYEPYADCETEDGIVDGRLLRFLDAENFNEKLNVLTYLKSGLDDKIIDAMAAAMDVEVPAGSMEERYRSLRSVIMAHSKYECSRLRE